jgi:hypothetical protein
VRQAAVAAVAVAAASLGLLAQPAAAQSPSDREIAKAGVFQADDFPAGWRATPDKKSEDPFKCPEVEKAVKGLKKQQTAKASGDDFEQGDEQYSSGAVVLRSEDVARRAYKVVASDALQRCIKRTFSDEVKSKGDEEGVDVKVEFGTVTGSGSYGDESSDIGMKITVSQGSLSQDLFADIVFVRVGRALGAYSHISISDVDKECGGSSTDDCVSFDALITSATDRLVEEPR